MYCTAGVEDKRHEREFKIKSEYGNKPLLYSTNYRAALSHL
jgi:hypothetical protein